MILPVWQSLAIIGLVVLGTVATRALPFLLFPEHRPVPAFVGYLGSVLPCAMMGLLVVYSLKGVSFASAGGWLPAAAGVICVAALHKWKSNMLLSIAGGTAVYMLLVQTVLR